jgi:hypothetical protein
MGQHCRRLLLYPYIRRVTILLVLDSEWAICCPTLAAPSRYYGISIFAVLLLERQPLPGGWGNVGRKFKFQCSFLVPFHSHTLLLLSLSGWRIAFVILLRDAINVDPRSLELKRQLNWEQIALCLPKQNGKALSIVVYASVAMMIPPHYCSCICLSCHDDSPLITSLHKK